MIVSAVFDWLCRRRAGVAVVALSAVVTEAAAFVVALPMLWLLPLLSLSVSLYLYLSVCVVPVVVEVFVWC